MAFSAGYEVSFEPEGETVFASGDRTAIERSVTNLVQNPIEHGGLSGKITISITAPAVIEVRDEGGGVPLSERERIFEPFYRLCPQDHGAGSASTSYRRSCNCMAGVSRSSTASRMAPSSG
ncbi:sensor histidine kinase [Mesorhizobium sp. Root695]|uniref:sensor histidine kinase n=1 Tax=Mesorhizobium sp. Root695 TaxID=1736589 RepID=UPI001FCD6FCB|nr:HAMP domain-containing sensor histidine kinase [Mesorhizobium sp. Root695]